MEKPEMEKPEFESEREAQRFNEIVVEEESIDDRAISLLQRLKTQGVEVPREVAQIAVLLHDLDPYPDNLGDRWTRPANPPSTNQMSDNFSHDFDALWYQGRI